MPLSVFKKRGLVLLIVAFVFMNFMAFFHAYKFTHFSEYTTKTKSPEALSFIEKMTSVLMGVNNPRPANKIKPKQYFKSITLNSTIKTALWYIPADTLAGPAKGTIALFHGYSADKSTMLDKANELLEMGYNTVLVDFMGSGESVGIQTTIGYKEAEQVKEIYEYLAVRGEKNIYLMGTSMGAAAILRAISVYDISPKGIVLECPFGSMYETVCARFRIMHLPCFPMASLLVFWGGVQNGFWSFSHKPSHYARNVHCKALLMYGEQDMNVSRAETDEIYTKLAGAKKLILFKNAGHENYLLQYIKEWVSAVAAFLEKK